MRVYAYLASFSEGGSLFLHHGASLRQAEIDGAATKTGDVKEMARTG
jgi:hypothetical protein